MTGFDNTYDPLAWGSHLPALLACLADTVGPVLEIGVGHFSTPALHAYCVTAGRRLTSVESDPKWMVEFESKYRCKGHDFTSSTMPLQDSLTWAVVLVDDSPGGENRANHFKSFLKNSIYVVVHDYHLENEEHIAPLLNGCHTHVTKTYQPPTLVASNHRDIPESITIL